MPGVDDTSKIGSAGAGQAEAPVVAITMGDPLGIGAETIVKSLSEAARRSSDTAGACYRVYGSAKVMEAAAAKAGIKAFWRVSGHDEVNDHAPGVTVLDDGVMEASGFRAGGAAEATKAGGAASYSWVERAIDDALRSPGDPARVDAIVTAPISKTSWDLAGHKKYPGHTELLAAKFHAKRAGMLFVGPRLKVMLATIHVPLMTVAQHLTIGRVLDAIELSERACAEMGIEKPRIAVCGLNPHAGEGGILGEEDDRLIAPAVALAARQGINVKGPLPGDTVFVQAAAPPIGRGAFDCVVAMYHDQGLIPAKLLDGYETVNVTVMDGAKSACVRTSPAHGTAFDIAGKNKADARSMGAAIDLALKLVAVRRAKARA